MLDTHLSLFHQLFRCEHLVHSLDGELIWRPCFAVTVHKSCAFVASKDARARVCVSPWCWAVVVRVTWVVILTRLSVCEWQAAQKAMSSARTHEHMCCPCATHTHMATPTATP